MIYYIMLPEDTNEDCLNDTNILGEDNGFGVFWSGSGLKALMNITEQCPEMLPDVRIKDASGKSLTIESFLNRIDKLQVRIPK
jgi:hypothetical protein